MRSPRPLSAAAGPHRFIWDLHYSPPDVLGHGYPISAIFGDTPRHPLGPAALPGEYTVRLTVDRKSYTQPLTLKMDPRVDITAAGLQQQFDLSMQAADGIHRDYSALTQVRAVRARIRAQRAAANAALGAGNKGATLGPATEALDSLVASIEGGGGGRFGGGGGGGGAAGGSLTSLNGELEGLLGTFEGADAVPTTQAAAALHDALARLDAILARWSAANGRTP